MNINPQTQSLLFSVPQEIRDRIYKLILGGKDIHIFENFFQIQGHVPEYARGLPNLHQDRLTGHWWIEAGFGYSICRCTEDTDSDRHAQTAALFKADLQSDNAYVGRSFTNRHIAHSCRLSFGDEDYGPRTLTTGRSLPPVYIDFALLSTCRQVYIEMKTGNSMLRIYSATITSSSMAFFKGLKDLQGQAADVHVAIHYEPCGSEKSKKNCRPSQQTRVMLYELGMKMENEIKGID
ncbi:hypothetical protein MRB53_041150 [Persea americana]|nr:hypothetical protein MRB53_041150 [Persea americana]